MPIGSGRRDAYGCLYAILGVGIGLYDCARIAAEVEVGKRGGSAGFERLDLRPELAREANAPIGKHLGDRSTHLFLGRWDTALSNPTVERLSHLAGRLEALVGVDRQRLRDQLFEARIGTRQSRRQPSDGRADALDARG
jgi:hypothetical protein